jgi:enterochelin esterase-like enzyme
MLVSVGVVAFVGYYIYPTPWASSSHAAPSDVTDFGTVETKTFSSEALDLTMQYAIYLPPGYDDPQNASVRYPVVYLLSGSPGGTNGWVKSGGMAMDTLLARGQVRPMILVVPQESPKPNTPHSNAGYADGPLGDWATYTTRDLVDEIDSSYRTVDSRDGRAIAGNSEGGYGAMNLGLKNPSEYGVIGSFSGYFTVDQHDLANVFGGDQDLADANSPMTYLPQLEGELPAIWFVAGEDDQKYLGGNLEFAEELKARGASYEFNTYPGEHKSTRERLPDFLVFASEHLTGGE